MKHNTESSPTDIDKSDGFLGFISQIKQGFEKHKDQIGLAILIIYVVTLAIATVVELLEH